MPRRRPKTAHAPPLPPSRTHRYSGPVPSLSRGATDGTAVSCRFAAGIFPRTDGESEHYSGSSEYGESSVTQLPLQISADQRQVSANGRDRLGVQPLHRLDLFGFRHRFQFTLDDGKILERSLAFFQPALQGVSF